MLIIKQEALMLHNTKSTIQNEDRTITNIYAPINTAANFTKVTLKIMQQEIYRYLLIVGDFDTELLA